MELHHDIKAANLSDVEFLEKVAMAEANESERLGKVKAKADIAALTENKTGSGAGNPSSAPQQAAPKQKNNSREPENKQVLDKVDLLVSKIDSLTTYSEQQTKRIAVMEAQLAQGVPSTFIPFGNLHDSSDSGILSTNRRHNGDGTDGRRGDGRRVVFKCNKCIEEGIGYCNHCFKCGSTQHKKLDCPRKN